MDFKRILFGAVIVIIIYIFYTSVFVDKSKNDLVTMHNGMKNELRINSEKLSVSKSADYTYAFWVYVNDYNKFYGDEKVLLKRSVTKGNKEIIFPKISLGENQNDMHFKLTTGQRSADIADHHITVNNIPLQKWNHIIMTKSGNTIDIYLDGKLVKTSILPATAHSVEDEDIIITPKPDGASDYGFAGYMSKVNYYPNAINTREAYQLYKDGYGSGMLGDFFNRFKLKFAFLQDNQEKSSIIL